MNPATDRRAADVAEDVEFILSHHPATPAKEIATRLGYSDSSGLYLALTRATRPDLRDTLKRNAALAAIHHDQRSTR